MSIRPVLRYQYNIINYKKGILVLFKTYNIKDTSDMTSDLEIVVEAAPDAFTEDWTAIGLECSNPTNPEVNQLLFDVTEGLKKHDATNIKDIITLCEEIAIYSNEVYCFKEGILSRATG